MKSAYRVLAYLVAIEVAIQAMVMVYAVAGLGLWIDQGGVLNKAAFESGESLFPEMIGLFVHFLNGTMVIPALALALLIVSFFTRLPGAIKWAGIVLGLVLIQVLLGLFGHAFSALGALHGLNALLLFSAAAYAAHRVRATAAVPAREDVRVPTGT